MKKKKDLLIKHCLEKGIFLPTAEIYGGIAGFYDFGPIGVKIKNKYISLWRKEIVEDTENIFEIDGAVVLPYEVLKASGHVDSFTDPVVECKKCGYVYRADKLIGEILNINADVLSKEELEELIRKHNIRCQKCGGELGEVKYFNLMFEVKVGAYKQAKKAFLRPETAQSMFLDFYRIYKSINPKFPFGLAQVGKSFRNEISPRKFVVRMREFYQMEIEWFVLRDPNCDVKKKPNCRDCKKCMMNNHPKFHEVKDVKIRILTREAQKKGLEEAEEDTVENFVMRGIIPNEHVAYFMAKEWLFMKRFIPEEDMYFRHLLEEETPFYSAGNFDLEIITEFGNIEVWPIAYRTDYDLKVHSKHSGIDLTVEYMGKKIYPHVIEPSSGIERPIIAILEKAFVIDEKRGYNWLKLHPLIAPYLCSVHPLIINKEEFLRKAREIYEYLKENEIDVILELGKGSIGKAYARMDTIGIPYNITIDYQTFEDSTVTIRFRDTKKQIRVKIEDLPKKIKQLAKIYPKFE